MTAAVTAYLPRKLGLETLESADDKNESAIYQQTYGYAREVLNRKAATSDMKDRKVAAPAHLSAEHSKLFVEGSEVYAREGHCITCHQVMVMDCQTRIPASGRSEAGNWGSR